MSEKTQEQIQARSSTLADQNYSSQSAESKAPAQLYKAELEESATKHNSYRVIDRRHVNDRRKQSRRILDKERQKAARPAKDSWDKIGALAPIISGSLIFVMGGWFTYTFNQQQLRLQEVQTIEKFIPHLMGNEQSKKAAILAISAMTNPELAGKFASIFASSGTVSALQKIATTGTDQEKTVANKALSDALETLAARDSNLNDIESTYRKAIANHGADADAAKADLAYKMNKLAQSYTIKDQYSLAEPLFKKSLELREGLYGAGNPMVAEVLKGMAEMYQSSGQPEQAETCLKRAREIEANAQPSASETLKATSAPTEPISSPPHGEPAPSKEPDKDSHVQSTSANEAKQHPPAQHAADGKVHLNAAPDNSHALPQAGTAGDAPHGAANPEAEQP